MKRSEISNKTNNHQTGDVVEARHIVATQGVEVIEVVEQTVEVEAVGGAEVAHECCSRQLAELRITYHLCEVGFSTEPSRRKRIVCMSDAWLLPVFHCQVRDCRKIWAEESFDRRGIT